MDDSPTSTTPEPASPGAQPAPGAADKLDRLRALLREMFQLDRGDLDFGLYRIMNLKSAEVVSFLDNDLLPQVKEKLQLTSAEERASLEKELEDARETARGLGVDPDRNPPPKIVELNRRLAEMQKDADAEADVYNHLANFFGRYYAEGDFISQRRYSSGGRSAYLIPYDGEEVKLHWANADQYYVKTTENYASYVFTVGSGPAARRVRFEIAAADNEKDNVKEANGRQRRFVLAGGKGAVDGAGAELVVRFEHRPLTEGEKKKWPGNGGAQQGRINGEAVGRILRSVDPDWRMPLAERAPTDADPERTLLAGHVDRYTAKNSFDYFIHKDLGGFLRRELDLYLNTDVLNLDDLERGDAGRLDRALARVRATRHVGRKVIDFLAQLEDFQKRLWLKKKFVLETNWCVTLDRVPEALYPEVAANAAQCREWVELLAADEITGDLTNGNAAWSDPPTVDFLKANPCFVVDTRYFDRDFTERLVAALSEAGPLDEQTDGLLVHGENFQALNLLQARYSGQVGCVYIDPPYNTGDSEILYKNRHMRSSWLSLIANRLDLTQDLLASDPVLYIAIDDFEMPNLANLVDTSFPWMRRETIIVNHHPQGGKARTLAHTHEYMFACVRRSSGRVLVGRTREDGEPERRPFMRSGTGESNFRRGRPNSFYAVLLDPGSGRVVGLEPPPTGPEYPRESTSDGYRRVYPLGGDGAERVWRRSFESCQELVQNNRLRCSNGKTIYHLIEAEERSAALFSNWTGSRYNAGTFGATLLSDVIGAHNPFSYPKSIYTVEDAIFAADANGNSCILDFFAGSGTTGHAVVNLNREDRRGRRYVLVEMGHHFDTVMLPRMKKVLYSPDWKDGRPLSRNGVSQVLKYVRLESYEDSMDSLDVAPPSDSRTELFAASAELAEDYRLRYALSVETSGSACLLGKEFTDPFAYRLSVVRGGARRDVPVDLPETFNWLIGLRVESRRRSDGVLAITGVDAQGRRSLVLWRNLDEVDNTALDAWFDRNRMRVPDGLDLVCVNGDHTLNALRRPGETWVAESTEPLFRKLMFEE